MTSFLIQLDKFCSKNVKFSYEIRIFKVKICQIIMFRGKLLSTSAMKNLTDKNHYRLSLKQRQRHLWTVYQNNNKEKIWPFYLPVVNIKMTCINGIHRGPPTSRRLGIKVTSWFNKLSLRECNLALVASHSEASDERGNDWDGLEVTVPVIWDCCNKSISLSGLITNLKLVKSHESMIEMVSRLQFLWDLTSFL